MKKKNNILSAILARQIALMTVCIIGLSGTMQAQQIETMKRTQWGVKAAMNIASLHFNASKGESESSKSFVGGAVGLTFTYAFDSHWRIHSGVELSLKGFTADETGGSRTLTAKAAYVQVPVMGGYALEFGKWTFEPRMGAFFAYGVAGKYSVSGGGESRQTFGDKLLNPFDAGLTFGLHVDNGKFAFGIGTEMGLAEANGKNFTVSGGTMHMHNTFFSVGYLF
ncbi:Uncharacterised protein [Bacteroides heparinolyticus]|uniref:Outer membrane protein beta-barrel domain-containing protein n=1 Tax=Prevotella heparinolytica TaxID=28113 RepID=A0A449I2W6_9BACE|nr:porin family protein [Bacteroides heparinolyticus]VFB13791.1 Uncharacterised protein [Bacteroides heparinolyticus]